jgi:hypothetical protein
MARPVSWVEATKRAKEAQQVVSSQNRKPSFIPHPKPINPTTPSTPLKIQKLTRAKMDERQLKGLCYNCDEKYFPGHKCKEKNLFMAISEEISEEDEETPSMSESPESTDITPPSDPPVVEPVISLNALTGFSAPQTLKLISYIKHQKVIILVDSGSTHNFIHRRIAQETHCYIHAINNFKIMIANGGSMKCGGCCENVRLQIGDYHLKSHMFAIDMGGCDIVLGADWLRTLGPILMDFKYLTMQFDKEGHQYKFQGITAGSPEIISSHRMEKLLKKGHSGVIAQLHAIQATKTPSVSQDLQAILSKHQLVFSTPQGLPPSCGVHDHSIPLVPGSLPPNIRSYRHPFSQKNEIEKMVQELLNAGVIRPSTSIHKRKKVLGETFVPSKNLIKDKCIETKHIFIWATRHTIQERHRFTWFTQYKWATSTREIARSFLYYYPTNEGIQPTAKPAVTSSSFSHSLLSQNTIFTTIHSRDTFPS